jgi:hypothetical protein
LLLTVPFSVAPEVVTKVAALVVTLGSLQTGEDITSVNVPKFVELVVTPEIVDVPVWAMLPLVDVEVVGRTLMPCQVSVFVLVPTSVTVKVIAVEVMELTAIDVPVATLLIFLEAVPLPVNNIVTLAVESNSNPLGAVKTMLPKPILAAAVSVRTGPVSVYHVPAALQLVAVLEAIAPPPVAVVTVAAFTPPPKVNKPTKMKITFVARKLVINVRRCSAHSG